MNESNDAERFFDRLAAQAGTPALGAEEIEPVLDLARVVAHTVERRLAPLTAYALGLGLDASLPPAERARRVRGLVGTLERMAREAGDPGQDAAGGDASVSGDTAGGSRA